MPKVGSFWVSLRRAEFLCRTPARHDERSHSTYSSRNSKEANDCRTMA